MDKTYRLPNGTVLHLKMNAISTIIKDKGLDPAGDVQMFHTQNVLRRMIKYMPYRSGMTIKVMVAQTDIRKPQIILNVPYGQVLYRGIVMVDPAINAAGFQLKDGTWRSRKGSKKVPGGRQLQYTRSKNALAGPYWDRRLKAAEGAKLRQELQNYINRRAGR